MMVMRTCFMSMAAVIFMCFFGVLMAAMMLLMMVMMMFFTFAAMGMMMAVMPVMMFMKMCFFRFGCFRYARNFNIKISCIYAAFICARINQFIFAKVHLFKFCFYISSVSAKVNQRAKQHIAADSGKCFYVKCFFHVLTSYD